MTLQEHFKVFKTWDHSQIKPENVLDLTSFFFTMKSFKGLYFKLKEQLPDPYGVGMNCFQLEFDTDNGISLKDGDMRFNDFMGNDITDSGVDSIGFIKKYLIDNDLNQLIK